MVQRVKQLKINSKKLFKMKRVSVLLIVMLFVSALMAQNSSIRVESQGKGDPVIFLPGFTCPASVFDSTIENIKGNHKFVKITYAGFAGVPAVELPWYPKLVEDISKYISDNKLENITVIGHSMGGNLAMDLASKFGKKVNKMILIDAIPCMRELMMPGSDASAISYESPYNKQMYEMKDEAFKQVARMMSTNMTSRAENVDLLMKWITESDRKTYVYGYTDLLKLDCRPG